MSAYSDAVLASSPMLYYRFNETSGSVIDASPNARHGSIVGSGVTRARPRLGPRDAGATEYSCGFSATAAASYVQTPITTLSSVMTFELLFNASAAQTNQRGYVLGKARHYANTQAELPLALVYGQGLLQWQLDRGNDYIADISIPALAQAGETHLVHAIYRSAAECELWLNGALAGKATLSGAAATNAFPITIGGVAELTGGVGTTTLVGRIDEVAIYNTALSESTIKARQELRFAGSDFSGNVTKITGGPADRVIVWNWTTSHVVRVLTPSASGDWSCGLPPGDYGMTYIGTACQPVTHGPYTVTA
ncbi:MAG: LamG-like jellyroll fold domain-containing protein [Candidatus Dactylopiibacterium sp.]|nr:LamG-like jellyroll fold domain-containing protein [Candidatus Dactylopiibacterium sp.]